eukprot:TRINITY_DN26461_c0_g1_i1.p1 TRINITY_DN26461_c0_g1~~TRINITY_DN26461_c0_g1_i1.p1  ORF type:complete len:158 (-),score=37.93 TRINITY_DN26461_c0_g1_i1:42-515(-)
MGISECKIKESLKKDDTFKELHDAGKINPEPGLIEHSIKNIQEAKVSGHFEKLASYLDEIVKGPVEPLVEESAKSKTSTENVELAEAYRTIDSLKKILQQERANQELREKEQKDKEALNSMKQKKEFEEVIERQISFIDQLVKDLSLIHICRCRRAI